LVLCYGTCIDWVLRCEIYTTHILVFWLIAFCVDEQRANSDGLHEDSDGAGARDRDAAPNYL
jgi:hypothetical protein